jgi:hypothetical protein
MNRTQFFYVDFSCDLSTANALFGIVACAHLAFSAEPFLEFQAVSEE